MSGADGASRDWAIIGVVGRTFSDGEEADSALLQLAHDVGAQIATRGHAVLTGGCHRVPERSVKYCALQGAEGVASSEKAVRLIGILPRRLATKFDASLKKKDARYSSEGSLRWLYGNTGRSSNSRNEITGPAADVLIVVHGETGTPQEVAYAIKAGRPCVFLNSWDEKFRKTLREKWGNIAPEATWPQPPLCADSAEDAVAKAEAAINWDNPTARKLDGKVAPDSPAGPEFKTHYDAEFRKLLTP